MCVSIPRWRRVAATARAKQEVEKQQQQQQQQDVVASATASPAATAATAAAAAAGAATAQPAGQEELSAAAAVLRRVRIKKTQHIFRIFEKLSIKSKYSSKFFYRRQKNKLETPTLQLVVQSHTGTQKPTVCGWVDGLDGWWQRSGLEGWRPLEEVYLVLRPSQKVRLPLTLYAPIFCQRTPINNYNNGHSSSSRSSSSSN